MRGTLAIVRLLGVRHLWRHGLRSTLTVVALACGVAGTVAATLLYGAFVTAHEEAVAAVSQGADLQIANGDAGVPASVVAAVRAVAGVATADPVARGWITARGLPSRLHVLGVDLVSARPQVGARPAPAVIDDPLLFLSDPHAIAIPTAAAERYGWRLGQRLAVRGPSGRRTLTVRAIFEPTRSVARSLDTQLLVMDLPAAQRLLGLEGRVSHVDVRLAAGTAVDHVEAALADAVAGRAWVARPAASGATTRRLLSSYRYALGVGAALCLVVACYVVVNVVVISIAQRRRDLETLRRVGTTGRQVRALLVGEASMLGLVGGGLGTALGVWLARSLAMPGGRVVGLVHQPIGDPVVRVDATTVAFAAAITLAIAGLAAAIAIRCELRHRSGARASGIDGGRVQRLMLGAGVGSLALALASWCVGAHAATLRPLSAVTTSVAALVGTALGGPGLLAVLARHAEGPLERALGCVGLLAARTISTELGRVMMSASGLLASLAGVLGFAGLLASLDRSLAHGLRTALAGVDLVVTGGGEAVSAESTPIPAATVDTIRAVPGVAYVDPITVQTVPHRGQVAALVASDARLLLDGRRGLQVAATDRGRALASLAAGRAVLVTDSFTRRFGHRVGETVTLATPSGAVRLPIAGIYLFEPSVGDVGAIRLDRRLLERWWPGGAVSAVHVTLRGQADARTVARRIQRRLGRAHDLFTVTTHELRARYHGVLHRLGSMLAPMVAIACLVGTLGLMAGRLAAVEGRRRLFGILRAVGATRRQGAAVLTTESTLVGLLVAATAVLGGSVLGYLEVRVILQDACGIRVPYTSPTGAMALVFVAATVVAGASGYLQGRLVMPRGHARGGGVRARV